MIFFLLKKKKKYAAWCKAMHTLPTCITICVSLIRSPRLQASITSWGILALFFSPHLACLVPVPPSSPTVPCCGARLALGDILLRPQKLAKQMAGCRKTEKICSCSLSMASSCFTVLLGIHLETFSSVGLRIHFPKAYPGFRAPTRLDFV